MAMTLADKHDHGHPLPANPYPQNSDVYTAYGHCLVLEQSPAGPPFEESLESMSSIVAARVLGYGLLYAPNEIGRDALMRDILECKQERRKLGVLASLYVHGLIRIFYNPKGPTPAVTPVYTPRLSFEAAAQNSLILQPSSSTASHLRALTLLRDEYRCVITGRVDLKSYNIAPNVVPNITKGASTNVAHIISQSIPENTAGDSPAKSQWAKTAEALIERFGGFSAHDVLGEANLHSPQNAFTASTDPHYLFDELDMWLTPAKDAHDEVIPDTYHVCLHESVRHKIDFQPQVVHFRTGTSPKGKPIPPPDSRIIALHAACANIAHMSGAVQVLRELYRDTDDIAVMTEPNAAYELNRALRALQLTSATAAGDVVVRRMREGG